MSVRGVLVLGCVALTGCSSMPSMSSLSLPGRGPVLSHEQFTYTPAADTRVRLMVESLSVKGDPGFIPNDRNWLQVGIRITNKSGHTITITEVGERLADGTVLKSAKTMDELVRPPIFKNAAVSSGLTVGSMMLFPPLAVAGAIAGVAYPLYTANKAGRMVERVNQEGLKAGPVAPGTSCAGLIFVPAVVNQSGLILFYQVDGKQQSLIVERAH